MAGRPACGPYGIAMGHRIFIVCALHSALCTSGHEWYNKKQYKRKEYLLCTAGSGPYALERSAIRKRLLAANYLMILMPVLCFALLSLGIFWIFGLENLNRSSIISFIWPESGPNLTIQFELTRLRVGPTISNRTIPIP